MASTIDSFTSFLNPEVTERIHSATGLEPNLIRRGLAVIGPLVGAFAARAATSPGGLARLLNLLPSGIDVSTPAGVDAVIRLSKDQRVSAGTLSGIFGSAVGPVTGTLRRALVFDPSSLLRIGAPLMLGALSRRITESALDDSSAAKLLQAEHRAFLARNDDVARTVQEALYASDQASALRQKYTPHEWATARLAPLAAAQVVMLASPSGVVGAVNELASAAQAIKRARGSAVPASLVGLLFDGEITKDEVMALRDRQVALSVVKEGIAAVKANTPSEAKTYGNLLVDIAVKTAEGTREAGVPGPPGARVTREEQAAIDAIRSVAD